MTVLPADLAFIGLAGAWLAGALVLGAAQLRGWPRGAPLTDVSARLIRLGASAFALYIVARLLAGHLAEMAGR